MSNLLPRRTGLDIQRSWGLWISTNFLRKPWRYPIGRENIVDGWCVPWYVYMFDKDSKVAIQVSYMINYQQSLYMFLTLYVWRKRFMIGTDVECHEHIVYSKSNKKSIVKYYKNLLQKLCIDLYIDYII